MKSVRFQYIIVLLTFWHFSLQTCHAFSHNKNNIRMLVSQYSSSTTTLLYSNDDIQEEEEQRQERRFSPGGRWHSLNPKIKEQLIKEGQARAIRNKKKREPAREKKRRMLTYFLKRQKEKKIASKIKRELKFSERKALSECIPGEKVAGKVISLTNFGAYVDIGTECDGLLHVSQITRDFFVEHPRQVFRPGDDIEVTIKSRNPDLKKLQLTMLEYDAEQERMEQEYKNIDYDLDDRIQLEELQVDDELWGETKRVTDFGSYVEVGSVVDGFLHFMDHPTWGYLKMQQQQEEEPPHPSEFMSRGDRVRVWVSDIDLEKRRIKLTANRPSHLPGPRAEIKF